jgi:hypothetical protein
MFNYYTRSTAASQLHFATASYTDMSRASPCMLRAAGYAQVETTDGVCKRCHGGVHDDVR